MKTKTILSVIMIVGILGVMLNVSPLYGAKPLTTIERLGKHIFQDKDLSFNGTQSCESCHTPLAGFSNLSNSLHPYRYVVSLGADGVSLGGRNDLTAAYVGFSPILHQDEEGNWIGGSFWDGRATGERLGDPIAEQALGPFLNPKEMAMPDKEAVVAGVQASSYARQFLLVFGPDAFNDTDKAYDNIGRALAAYERSHEVTRFKSKFDKFWEHCNAVGIDTGDITAANVKYVPKGILNRQELRGLVLFNTKGGCKECHPSAKPDYAPYPLFTDFSYDNLGIPVNPKLAGNPTDYGLGPIVADPTKNGAFKVPTLRNIERTAPYGHNGYFPTLKKIVHFYNTRDVAPWPPAEIPGTVNKVETGNIGLTSRQENDIVAFLLTLTDK
ncbi:MAG TPA: cytochrome c peroxidase [Candidatus Deferrimicrobium sp.]|nr:cytochrome c peroxidase [Candidatus Deferrimicrobium sp.]